MLAMLAKHHVHFVVIGGVAATAHASPYPTIDLDICPADHSENLQRLADALNEMGAGIRVIDESQPRAVDFDVRILRATPILNLMTPWGPLDIVLRPAGTHGYEDLTRDALTVKIGKVEVAVASRADVIRSKQAVGRDKDLQAVQVLRELEERDPQEKRRERRKGRQA